MALTEQEFLAAIARKLGRAPLASPPPRPGHVRTGPQPPAQMAGRAARVEWFTSELAQLTGTFTVASSLAEAGEAVAEYVRASCPAGGDVVLNDEPVVLAARGPLQGAGYAVRVWPQDRAVSAHAVAGVTSVRYAIAETGSVAVVAEPGQGRTVSLVPPVHVAVLPTSRILATVADYFRTLGTLERMPAGLNLITGPSRTADIELELSIGVHGPGAIHVVLYND